MTRTNPPEPERLQELLADEQLDQLSLEDRAELDRQRPPGLERYDTAVSMLIQRLGKDAAPLPADVQARLARHGRRIVGGQTHAFPQAPSVPRARRLAPLLWAAVLVIAGGATLLVYRATVERQRAQDAAARAAAALAEARRSSAELLAQAQGRAEELARALAAADTRSTDLQRQLAEAAARQVRTAQELHDATARLDAATLKLARYEAPVDPAAVALGRQKLLDVPGTVRIAWKPFDLPDAPAEQRDIAGDVVWNDELERGFLRFVGLKPNDPAVEQYQVWVIDERGMEQRVSGGIFNASVEGEVIVPIQPGIDLRRVSLFAVTIEEPGGTWVSSLKRRVVVAPRES